MRRRTVCPAVCPAPRTPNVQTGRVIECVVNVSEGRDPRILDGLADAAGSDLLDVHRDPDHHRSVFTLVGEAAPRRLTAVALDRLDLGPHSGVHPRLGVVDVVPFVDLSEPHRASAEAVRARDEFAAWAADTHGVPTFLYGPSIGGPIGLERTLPEVRRRAFVDLAPDHGPAAPHPTAGAICVGARPILVAYNVWLPRGTDLMTTRRIASDVRRPGLRTLGLMVGGRPQVSMNLVEPWRISPADAFDAVRDRCRTENIDTDGAELVGLLPRAVLDAIPDGRWAELDLDIGRTIEARLAG